VGKCTSLTLVRPQELLQTPEAIAAFVDRLRIKVQSYEGLERRAHPRYVTAIPSLVQPVEIEIHPIGDPIAAATRDISLGGVGFLQPKSVDTEFIAIELMGESGERMHALAKVLRCRPLGGFFDVGCKLVTC
jgi:hypothetical protein